MRSFRFPNLYSWTPLSDQQVAVYSRPDQTWLLDFGGGCQGISFVNSIGLTSSINQSTVGFDKVLTGRNNFPRPSTRIRPIDMKGLKAMEQAQRQISNAPRTESRTDG